ncbi:MAG: potassium transporter Kup [Candidatus Dactylopiibacterium carminicum]|uniref:Probable potassium transport system protein Kup n=1 Tax=Candidatus Dactylopiibacterium carminicum TaxID=857335 RepID=A0A272EVE9_9RHOO|nr:potassium transporter Kup [Candidatus Dactylopiibacterium carminicum]KAF7600087.1 potassium transporter Kup [Candidatus Dactylopiibacterium carminicum]PAS94083.1 MAG: potassium transporter Kup [Candidatus Dactylopiibacterium carminicum]PAS98154.1 MAG: potassium transporter Kup [Candidatus Dactylopiibacterium carminicum]PAT00090.1 MAG: potassium transporter Kup [Candidatus Dactylopiibacterium carminicum]
MSSTESGMSASRKRLAALTLAATGVVYGDIGTSPLYTMKEIFGGHGIPPNMPNVLGILSLVFWALMLVVSLKYVLFIMRADNRGEGGIMALTALANRAVQGSPRKMWLLTILGLFGAALFYGDGVITPAMSVLSAVEGLHIATPAFDGFVVPIAIGVLLSLFWMQSRGTGQVGTLFGPVMVFWFLTLGALGVLQVVEQPRVLLALNPWYGLSFFAEHRILGFLALGSVVLAVTGGEALYADMGHFGRRPIKLAWFGLVLPCIYLNYLGQGALLLSDPAAVRNPFYLLAPGWLLYPLIGLATAATIIASQAVISGAFSLTRQATQLGYCPRIAFIHTSSHEIGQVYVPGVNWALLVAVVAVVLGFRSSSNLASAYGIAVTLTMLIDTLLAFVVVRHLWRWSLSKGFVFLVGFLVVDLAFVIACAVKILDGGWFPLGLGAAIFTLMATWRRGRDLLGERTRVETMPLDLFIQSLFHSPPHRVAGTGVFMTSNPEGVPRLLHNLLHNKVLHERIVLLTVVTEDVPTVPEIDRVECESLDYGFHRILVRYGFKEAPDIPAALQQLSSEGKFSFALMETTFFLGRERLVPHRKPGMAMWRERLFFFMFRNASSAADFFHIPPNRVVEFGTQVEI